MAADVDRISAGRLVLGMAIDNLPEEFAQLGMRYPAAAERQRALEDALRIVAGLWRGTPFTHDGADARVREAVCAPGPVQQPRVPVLIAGGGERVTLRQVGVLFSVIITPCGSPTSCPVATPAAGTRGRRSHRAARPGPASSGHDAAEPGW